MSEGISLVCGKLQELIKEGVVDGGIESQAGWIAKISDAHEKMSKWELEHLGGKQAFSGAFNPLVAYLQIQTIKGQTTRSVVNDL